MIFLVKLTGTFQERQEGESICVVYLQASAYVQMHVWSADPHTSLYQTLLLRTARSTLLLRNYFSKSMKPIQYEPASATKQNKLHKVDLSILCLSLYVQVMSGARAYFLSSPLQILSGFKCRVGFFPFYPSFLYLCPSRTAPCPLALTGSCRVAVMTPCLE